VSSHRCAPRWRFVPKPKKEQLNEGIDIALKSVEKSLPANGTILFFDRVSMHGLHGFRPFFLASIGAV
jgi:hypothetical protein